MEEVEIRQKKRSNGPLVVLLCFAFLLIGAGVSYLYLTKYSNINTNNTIPEESAIVEIGTESVLVKDLIDRIDINTNCGVERGLYTKSNFKVEDFDKNYMMRLVAKEANGKNLNNYVSFTKEAFDNSVKVLFGNGVVVENTNISGCPNINYDSANQIYLSDNSTSCNIDCKGIKYVRHIVKAEKTDQNIYIYVAVAAFDEIGKKVMNVNDLNSVIPGIDGNIFEISKDYDKVNNYIYTYNYDKENQNYIFKSIRLQK